MTGPDANTTKNIVASCAFKTIVNGISSVQMKSWAGKALETVNCCAFLKRRLIGAC
jgi:hypothetical protein